MSKRSLTAKVAAATVVVGGAAYLYRKSRYIIGEAKVAEVEKRGGCWFVRLDNDVEFIASAADAKKFEADKAANRPSLHKVDRYRKDPESHYPFGIYLELAKA